MPDAVLHIATISSEHLGRLHVNANASIRHTGPQKNAWLLTCWLPQ